MTEFHAYAPGLHAGGQPSPDDLARLQRVGVRSVINLRADSEDAGFDEAARAAELGLDHVRLPITGGDDLTDDAIARFGTVLDAAHERGDVLIHCASSNRVGALVALHAHANGTPARDAFALGQAAGLAGLAPTVAARLGLTP